MKRTCPTCGSSIDADNTTCPNCGESLAPLPSSSGTVICQECGSANPAGATECATCGEPLRAAPARVAERKSGPVAEKKKRPVWVDYLFAGAAVVVIALVVFLIAKPKEQTGPPETPQGMESQNGLPPGHPPTDQKALSAAQNQQIEMLTAKVQANPNDLPSKVQLANVLYDANRHSEALRYYREYLAAKPEDNDARTDMAYSLFETGSPDSAILELKRVLTAVPNHQNAAYNLGMMYVAKKNRDSVIYWLRRVITIDSTTMQAQRAGQLIKALEEAHEPGGAAGQAPAAGGGS